MKIEKEQRIEINIKQNKEEKLLYTLEDILKPHEGHPLFEIDVDAKEIRFVEMIPIHSVNINSWKQEIKEQSFVKREGCLYVSSLNVVNLRRKLAKYNKEISLFLFIGEVDVSLHKNRKINKLVS